MRFERLLVNITNPGGQTNYGLLVHDNNESVTHKHTKLVREFYVRGTLWAGVTKIIERLYLLIAVLRAWFRLPTYVLIRFAASSKTKNLTSSIEYSREPIKLVATL